MNKFRDWLKSNQRVSSFVGTVGLFAILVLLMGINLLYKARYREAIVMFILFLPLIFYICVAIFNPEKHTINKTAKKIKRDIEKEDNMENDEKNHIK